MICPYKADCTLSKFPDRHCNNPYTCQAYKVFKSYPIEVLNCEDTGIASRLEDLAKGDEDVA